MALHFSPVAAPLRNLEIWHANNSEYAFAISRERKTGPGPLGKLGYVASWRSMHHDKRTVTLGGSPFATFAEAEEACELLLMHLLTAQSDMTMPIDESLTRIWHQWVGRSPTSIDYGAAGARSGIASPRRSQLDLQEVGTGQREQQVIVVIACND